MDQMNTPNDLQQSDMAIDDKLPTGLNVLTILTFISCAIFGLITAFLPAFYNFLQGLMEKAASSGKEFSEKELADMEKGRLAIELAKQNLIPLMIIGLVSIALCFVGALWMRKRRKDGFWLYTAGELAPIVGGLIIMGTASFTGAMSIVTNIGIPLLFVFLYSLQRKHLTK